MNTALLLTRLLLAGVFAVAGFAKLVDRSGSRKTITDFGFPVSLAGVLSVGLPLIELTIAVALLAPRFAWWGGLGALSLLLLFTVAISINIALGRKTKCHCFGQLHSAPIGLSTLVRNSILAAGAVFVVAQGWGNPDPNVLSLLHNFTGTEIIILSFGAATVLALVAESWLVIHLMKQNGRLLLRIDELDLRLNAVGIPQIKNLVETGLPVGTAAPLFELPLVSGEHLALSSLLNGRKSVLLVFSDPNCNPCRALLTDIAAWERKFERELTPVIVSRGNKENNQAIVDPYGLKFVGLQTDREVAEMFLANTTPSAVLIGADGSIRSSLAIGSEAIIELVARTTGTAAPVALPLAGNGHHKNTPDSSFLKSGSKIGTLAPSFRLPDLNAKPVNLSDFQGRNVLLLFWNPSCRFCTGMLSELQSWERSEKYKQIDLLVISTGTAEANRAMNLQSTVLLDQDFGVGRSFAAGGTPSAVLIDASGKIASALAVGAPQVLALAETRAEHAMVLS